MHLLVPFSLCHPSPQRSLFSVPTSCLRFGLRFHFSPVLHSVLFVSFSYAHLPFDLFFFLWHSLIEPIRQLPLDRRLCIHHFSFGLLLHCSLSSTPAFPPTHVTQNSHQQFPLMRRRRFHAPVVGFLGYVRKYTLSGDTHTGSSEDEHSNTIKAHEAWRKRAPHIMRIASEVFRKQALHHIITHTLEAW